MRQTVVNHCEDLFCFIKTKPLSVFLDLKKRLFVALDLNLRNWPHNIEVIQMLGICCIWSYKMFLSLEISGKTSFRCHSHNSLLGIPHKFYSLMIRKIFVVLIYMYEI